LAELAGFLYQGYKFYAIHPLGEPGVDKMERWLVIIKGSEEAEFSAETQADRIRFAKPDEWGVTLASDMDEALRIASEEYNLPYEKISMHEKIGELDEEYPDIRSGEIESYLVLDALFKADSPNLGISRGLLDDEPVIAITFMVSGPDGMRMTPMAILMNESIAENLKLAGHS